MMSSGAPLLWAVIGPNGAGKSAYYKTRIQPRLEVPFINADDIAAAEWPGEEVARSYDAARLAQERRHDLLAARRSFVTETVFSHPSKLQLLRNAKQLGYNLWVTFIYLELADLAVTRVAERVGRGGHQVPARKIRERFKRMAEIGVKAVALAERAFVLDNSESRRPLREVLLFERGKVTLVSGDLPHWTTMLFAEYLHGRL